MPAASGLPLVGAQAVLLGMGQFNLSVAQVTRGLVQIGSSTRALEQSTLLATSRITSGFNNMSRGIGTASVGTTAALGSIGAAATGMAAAIVAASIATVAAAANFERALKPSVIFGGLSPENTEKLGDSILNLSRQWGVSSATIAKGSAELVKAGTAFDDLQDGVLQAATALNVASDGELNMAESARLLTQILKAYNLPASEASNITNILVGAAQNSTASFTELRQGLGQTLALFAQFNIPLREGITNLAILNDQNIRGERAGSAYRNLLLRMLDPAKDVAAVMLRYGISLQDTNGHMISARQFIERLSGAFSDNALAARGVTEAQAAADLATLGMSRALLGAASLAQQGTAAFDKYQAAINKIDANKVAEQFSDTTIRQAGRLFQNVSALAVAFGTPFNDAVRRSLTGLNDWLAAIDLGKVRAFATMLRDDIASAFNSVTAIIRTQISSIQDLLNSGVGQASSALGTIDVSAYVAAAQEVYNQAVQIINTVVATVQQTFTDTASFITSVIDAVSQSIQALVTQAVDIANAVIDTATGIINAVAQVIQQTYSAVATFVTQVVRRVVTALQPLIDFVTHDVMEAAGPILEFTKIVIAAIIVAIRVVQSMQEANQRAMQGTTETLLGAILTWDNLRKAVETAVADIRNRIVSAGDGANLLLQGMQIFLTQWRRQWQDIGNSVSIVVRFIGDRIGELFEFLSNQPIIGQFFKDLITQFNEAKAQVGAVFTSIGELPGNVFQKLRDSINQVGSDINATMTDIIDNVNRVIGDVRGTVEGVGTNLQAAFEDAKKIVQGLIPDISATATSAQDFLQRLVDGTKNAIGTAVPAVQAYLEKIRASIADMNRSGGITLVPPTAGGTTKLPGGGAGADDSVGFPVDQAEQMIKFVQQLLKDMPGVNKEFAKWVAELVSADPNRLQPIIAALKSQAGLVNEILQAQRQLLQTELELEQTNQRIAALNLQIQRLDLQARQAVLPIEAQLLQLQQRRLQVQAQMLPMQQAIAAIDRQIATLQRENLDLSRRRLLLQQQALPLQNAIADIDQRISQINRVNYDVERDRLLTQQALLPITNAMEDIQTRIQRLHREDFGMTRNILQLEAARLPIDQAIARIDQQIQQAQRENYQLAGQRIQLEIQSLEVRNQIADIDRAINDAQRVNYDLIRQRAQAELEALPIRQRIADIEDAITNSIDRQQQLTLRRNELIAQRQVTLTQRQLDDVERQLTNLWAQFNLRPTGAGAAALVPQIVNLEAERTRLQGILTPAQRALTDIQRTQEDINFQQELTVNSLEQQRLAEEALLAPIEARIRVLNREEAAANARNAVIIAGLQAQRQALQDILLPYDLQIQAVERVQEAARLQQEATVNGLNLERQHLQDLARPYTEQINRLHEIQDVTTITQQIQETFLQEELQRLQDLAQPYQDHLTQLQRDQAATQLRNDIAINGLLAERQRLEDLLLPITNAITAVDRERAAEELRRDIAINALEAQKRRIEDLMQPLADLLISIDNQTARLTIQRDLTTNAYDQMKLKLEALKLSEELYANQLEIIRAAEQLRLAQLIEKYQNALTASGAFTRQEVLDAVTRLNLWNDEKTRVDELRQKIVDLNTALGNTAGGFNPLPSNIGNTNTAITALRDLLGTANTGTNARVQQLADTIGNLSIGPTVRVQQLAAAIGVSSNQGLRDSLSQLNTQIGSGGSGTIFNLNALATAFSNASGAAGTSSLNTNALYQSLHNLSVIITTPIPNFTTASITATLDSLRDAFNRVIGYNVGGYTGIAGTLSMLYLITNSTAVQGYVDAFNRIGVALAGPSQNGAGGLAGAAGAAAIEFVNLVTAIDAVAASQATLNLVSARYIATVAASTAYAIQLSQVLGPSNVYQAVRDLILSGGIGFAEGGVVPGPYNQAQWAIVHGGERVIPTSAGVVEPTRVGTGQVVNNYNSIINNTYNFEARYERVQDPVTLSADVRSIIEMSRR